MKIVRFRYKNKIYFGEIKDNAIIPIQGPIFGKIKLAKKHLKPADVVLLAPVDPGKIICVGLNYKDHARELNMPIPDEPIIFIKPQTSVIGTGGEIIYPHGVKRLDYEAELAIIIGKKTKDVPPGKARDYVFGYTCLNDVTARDLQKKDGQWTRAKSFDTFCPVGPCIATGINPDNLSIKLYLNGKQKQASNLSKMAFKVDALVSFISGIMTLKPGDIIATGTPPGVGPMEIGDKVEVKIEKIGSLVNSVRAK